MLKNKSTGTKKTLTMTDGTPRYTVVAPAETLGTTKPTSGTGFISYTIQASDLPTFSVPPISKKYVVVLLAWGLNDATARTTLSWETYKDAATIVASATGTSIGVSKHWTVAMFYEADEAPTGKVFSMAVWDTAGIMTLEGFAILVYPTQVKVETGEILYNFGWENVTMPSPLAGIDGISQGGGNDSYNRWDENDVTSIGFIAVDSTKKIVYSEPYAFSHYFAEGSNKNKVTVSAQATYPYYIHPKYPHTLSYRVLNTEGKL